MKKLIALVLCILMVAGLFVGCGSESKPGASAGEDGREVITIGIPLILAAQIAAVVYILYKF